MVKLSSDYIPTRDGKALSHDQKQTREQVVGIFGRLNQQSQTKLIEALHQMKELGLMPHHALLGPKNEEGQDGRATEALLQKQKGGLLGSQIAPPPGLGIGATEDRNTPADATKEKTKGIGLDGGQGEQLSPENQMREQAAYLLSVLTTQDRNHPGLSQKVMADVRDNACTLTVMQDLATLASKDQAAGLGMGMEVTGSYPLASTLHPLSCPDVRQHQEQQAMTLPPHSHN